MPEAKGNQKIHVNEIEILFTGKKITAYGGFSLLALFFKKIGLSSFLGKAFPIREISPNALGSYPKILAFLLMLFAGGKRFAHLMYLGESQDVLAKLFGIERFPKASTTLTRFFGKVKSWMKAEALHVALWSFLSAVIPWDKIKEDDLTFDSHVCVRYGKQEGAKKGYNPKKPGRPSHHPILSFLNQSRYVVNLWNRSGNAKSANNAVQLLKETLARLKGHLSIRTVFADSGFYQIEFIQALEQEKLIYVMAVPLHQILQGQFFLPNLNWKEVAPGIEMAEFMFCHKAKEWEKERRYFVIREKLREDKETLGKQLTLFPDHVLSKDYRYRAYITNSEEEMKALWDRYRPRADDENRIKELIEDFGLNGFCLKSFFATEAAMQILCLMYNLFNLFRHEILSEKESKQRASTIRYKYWVIPAITGCQGKKFVLRLGVAARELRATLTYLFSRIQSAFSTPEAQLQCN